MQADSEKLLINKLEHKQNLHHLYLNRLGHPGLDHLNLQQQGSHGGDAGPRLAHFKTMPRVTTLPATHTAG